MKKISQAMAKDLVACLNETRYIQKEKDWHEWQLFRECLLIELGIIPFPIAYCEKHKPHRKKGVIRK